MKSTATTETTNIVRHPDLLIPAAGEEVAATRYEPIDAGESLPAVLVATPYRKDDRITFGSWEPSLQYIARHGYEVIVVDLVGTGASTGTKEPFTRAEGAELAEVVEWLAEQPWTTGRVGMFGLSYGAWTQYATAAHAPEALEAIVPVAVSPSVFASSCTGGVFNPLKRATWAAQMQATRALPPSRRDDDGRWAGIWQSRLDALRDGTPWLFQFLDHERRDAFWDDRSVAPEEITVPTLAACGYRDVHTGPMVEFFGDIEGPKRLLLGPWRHTMPEQGRECAIDFRRQVVEWFDRFLKDADNGALNYPTVAYWTERNGGWQVGAGLWRGADRWPDVTATGRGALTYTLASDGLIAGETVPGTIERDYEYDHTVGVDSVDRVGSIVNTGVDTNADDARSLTFETDPLDTPVELTGSGAATLRVRATTPEPVVAVRIGDVAPTGRTRMVTGGYLRASHREGHEAPRPLAPDEEVELTVPLKPKSHLFEPDHRMRVAVSAADFPRALPPNEQGTLTVVSRPEARSTVRFPGRTHGGIEFTDTVSLRSPDESVPLRSPYVVDSDTTWVTAREHVNDTVEFRTMEQYTLDLPHARGMTWSNEVVASVAAAEPGTAYLQTETEATLDYPTERVRVETSARVARSTASIATRVSVDEQLLFDERWRRSGR
ncbi:CocE/NonD family hydrolase [Halomarina halobia]|uniref:CocE/NonD family hydrolase n=1 Tax=Halomarina halobia TaxID=3033386 RepID=A0ABD6AEI8_9EURY|nr:CocE/NonD family hydrolase [Halomarina sp. PSR21]